MIRKRITVILWILFPVILYGSSHRIIEINTPHFTIVYPSEISDAAIDIACNAESAITSFINFLQYDPPARITLRITAPENTGIDSGNVFQQYSPGTIEVEATDDPGSGLRLSAIIFNRYMKLFSDNFNGVPGLEDGMISGLMDYIIHGIDDGSIMLLNDYVLNQRNVEFRADKNNYGNNKLQSCMAGFFWDYLVTGYGKDAAAQSLKDASYFGGFINSLCRVTGKDKTAINEGFRLYLERYIKPGKPDVYDIDAAFTDLSYTVISHGCSGNGGAYALLAEREGDYYIFSARDEKISGSAVKLRHGDIKFTSLAFCGDYIVVSGYNRYGSVMLNLDFTGRKILSEREFPFIYINHIHGDKTGLRILFSAEVGRQSSLFIYDMKSVSVIKTDTGGINLLYPSFTESGSILCISRDTVQSLILVDAATGSVTELYRTKNPLSGPVEDSSGRVLFSESVKGITDIRCIDRAAGTVEQLTSCSTSNMYPLVMNGKLLFLNFFKGGFRPVSLNSYLK